MAPNFEMSLFIAQLTSSIIFTDSPSRWGEILNAQNKEIGLISHPWNDLVSQIDKLNFVFSVNSELSFNRRIDNKFDDIRKSFRSLLSTVRKNTDEPDNRIIEKFKFRFLKSHKKLRLTEHDLSDYCFYGTVRCLIPKGGFIDNNVQRLLLTSGAGKNIDYMPMAIFVKR